MKAMLGKIHNFFNLERKNWKGPYAEAIIERLKLNYLLKTIQNIKLKNNLKIEPIFVKEN